MTVTLYAGTLSVGVDTSYELLARETPEAPQTTQAVPVADAAHQNYMGELCC